MFMSFPQLSGSPLCSLTSKQTSYLHSVGAEAGGIQAGMQVESTYF